MEERVEKKNSAQICGEPYGPSREVRWGRRIKAPAHPQCNRYPLQKMTDPEVMKGKLDKHLLEKKKEKKPG